MLPVAVRLRVTRNRPVLIAVQHGPHREILQFRRRLICGAFAAAADRTIAVSHGLAELIGRHPLLARACRPLAVIPNGVPEDGWRAELPPRRADGRIRLGMLAALEPYKDHSTLLRAIRHLQGRGRRVLLELVGSGSAERALRSLAAALGIDEDVQFAGDLDSAHVRERLGSWDVLVHATHSEAMSMALLEGMMSARPIVASDVWGVRGAITHGEVGLLVPEGDAEALADAIERLVDDEPFARGLGQAARSSARRRYGARRMAAAYEELARQVAREKGEAGA